MAILSLYRSVDLYQLVVHLGPHCSDHLPRLRLEALRGYLDRDEEALGKVQVVETWKLAAETVCGQSLILQIIVVRSFSIGN